MLPITLAHMIDLRGRERLNNIKKGVAPIAGVIALYGATIFLQKHLSAVMIVSLISLTVLIAGGLSKKYIGTFFGLLGAVGFIGIATQPWRLARIVSFTNPQANPDQNGWHVIQSWYGLGSGEMFGLGLGMSRQKFGPWLPENHTDFIVGIIGEEIGLFGITILMLLFVALFIKLLGVAAQADTKFTALLVYGISSQLFYQTLINLLVVSGWFPVTGMPMPFISYGGSATIVLFGAIGLIYNVISHHKKLA
jgi:cell division protein FtsW